MPLGLLPLGTGGADGRLPNGGLVSLGTGGGRVPTDGVAARVSVDANYGEGSEKAKQYDEAACLLSNGGYRPAGKGTSRSCGRADKSGF
jgi:hypothetical protein